MAIDDFLNQVSHWLTSNRQFKKISGQEQTLQGYSTSEVYYSIESAELRLVKFIKADSLEIETIPTYHHQEFTRLEGLRVQNNLNFAYLILIYIFEQSPPAELKLSVLESKMVSAVSRCSLLPWIVDLQVQQTTTHKGLPMGSFGLMGSGSPLAHPRQDGQPMVVEDTPDQPQREFALTSNSWPKITYAIMALCVSVAGVAMFRGAFSIGDADPQVMIDLGAKVNELIISGQYWRLISDIFLHFGLMHLVFNMVFLYSIGPGVESLFGKGRYLAIFLLAGLLGSTASFAFTSAMSAGASGALFGLLGAYLYFWLRNPKAGKQIGKAVVQLVAYNLLFGLLVRVVDNWAHLGGLLGGFLAAAMVGLPRERRSVFFPVGSGLVLVLFLAAGIWLGMFK